MDFKLDKATAQDLTQMKKDMQQAFQMGFEEVYGKTDDIILPEKDIDHSLNTKGAVTYKAVVDGQIVGGAIVVIDDDTKHNDLHLLYVKYGVQSKGIGKKMWDEIENRHKDTKVWQTCTPYFEKRNIHFYLNKCKFFIVSLDKDIGDEDFVGDAGGGMFTFKKWMR